MSGQWMQRASQPSAPGGMSIARRAHMTHRLLVLLLFSSACAQRSPAAEPVPHPGPPDAAAAPSAGEITVDGEPVTFAETYIKQLPVAGSYQVFATTTRSSCRELLDNLFDRREGERTLLFNIGERLVDDAGFATVVTDVFVRGAGEVAPGSRAAVAGSAAEGRTAEITVDFGGTIAVSGRLRATGCGARPRATPPAARGTASVSFAGRKVALTGATSKGDDVVLSTAPRDCSPSSPAAALILERQRGAWRARGQWLAREVANRSMIVKGVQEETRQLAVRAGPGGELALSGAGTIGGVPVALEGTIVATECPRD
jgi:hypothetical protein